MRNLEILGAKRLKPEVAGSNPVPETELTSVSANGTNSSLTTHKIGKPSKLITPLITKPQKLLDRKS